MESLVQSLNKARKVNLLTLCDDLGIDISQSPKNIDLNQIDNRVWRYDQDFVKVRLEVIVAERNEKEAGSEEKKLEAEKKKEN